MKAHADNDEKRTDPVESEPREVQTVDKPQTRVGHVKADDVDVYAGRHGDDGENHFLNTEPGEPGWLGNPFPVEVFERERSIKLFGEAFLKRLEADPALRREVAQLRGQVLGCWCHRLDEDEPRCHADLIADVVDRVLVRRDLSGATVEQEGSA